MPAFRNRVEQLIGQGNYTGARRAALQSQLQDPAGEYWQGGVAAPPVRQVGTDGVVREFKRGPIAASQSRQRMLQEQLIPATPEFREAAAEVAPGAALRQTAMGYTSLPDIPGVRYMTEPAGTGTGRRARAAQASQPAPVGPGGGNYRGLEGVGMGTVNGKSVLIPEAGQASDFRRAMSALGLNGNDVVDPRAVNDRLLAGEYAESGLGVPDDLAAVDPNVTRQGAIRKKLGEITRQHEIDVKKAGVRPPDPKAPKDTNAQDEKALRSDFNKLDQEWKKRDARIKKLQAETDNFRKLQRSGGFIPTDKVLENSNKLAELGVLKGEHGDRPDWNGYLQDRTAQGDPAAGRLSGSAGPGKTAAPAQSSFAPEVRSQLEGMDAETREAYALWYEENGQHEAAAEIRSLSAPVASR